MVVFDPLPPEIEAQWRELAAPGEETLLVAMSDIRHDGRFGVRWMVLTDRRVVVLPSLAPGVNGAVEVDITDISDARAEPLVGGGRLEINRNGHFTPIIEYTSSFGAKFNEIARGIQQLAKNEPFAVTTDIPRARCQKCQALLPDRDRNCPRCVRKMAVMLRIASYLKPYKLLTAVLIVATLGRALLQPIVPMITQAMIDDVLVPRENFTLLAWLVAALVAVNLANGGLEILGSWVGAWLSTRIIANMRARLYQVLERMSLSFHNRKGQGNLLSLVTRDTESLNYFLIDGAPYLVVNSAMLLFILTLLLLLSWQVTILVLIPLPIVVLGGTALVKRMRVLWSRVSQNWALLHGQLNESLLGIRVAKAFAQEEAEIGRFDRRNEAVAKATVHEARFWDSSFAALNFITGAGVFIAWFAGGSEVIDGDLSLGKLMAFIQLLWMLYGPLQWFNRVYNWMSRALVGADRIFDIMDTPTEPFDQPGKLAPRPLRGEVEFREVTFGYDKTKPVLRKVDLHVQPGEMVGLVGKSGAGKSTTAHLVCRFYEVDHGEVLIDGIDIRDIELTCLRDQIGVVLQEPFLFSGTVLENIRYSKPTADLPEVIAAARAANAHDFIVAKPEGYDTLVGERGNRLSVGEKQRVSIARAVLKDPRILILDEATASVDTETEFAIQQAISRLIKGRTTFAIAHRLSTLRNADRLVVMDEGTVAEVGTHEELLAKRGIYYNLVEMQQTVSRLRAVER
jgi:ATP-binding cassette subfamily B protein